jgi:hypothetical protein
MKRNSWCYPPSKPVWADLESGECVWRLQRAFQMAGAPCCIGSLWNINDETNVYFMDDLSSELAGDGALPSKRLIELITRSPGKDHRSVEL